MTNVDDTTALDRISPMICDGIGLEDRRDIFKQNRIGHARRVASIGCLK
jgi:hypothetical protein